MTRQSPADNRYSALIETIFRNGYEERHYKLVPADQISRDDLRAYDA